MESKTEMRLYPNLTDATAGAPMVAHLFKGDYSEASLEIADAIMMVAQLLRQDADAATAAIRKTFPRENLDRIERLLQIASIDDRRWRS